MAAVCFLRSYLLFCSDILSRGAVWKSDGNGQSCCVIVFVVRLFGFLFVYLFVCLFLIVPAFVCLVFWGLAVGGEMFALFCYAFVCLFVFLLCMFVCLFFFNFCCPQITL